MKRDSDGKLVEALPPCDTSRRNFCAAAGVGLVAIGLPACTSPASRWTTGPVDDPESGAVGNGPADMAQPAAADSGSTPRPDLATSRANDLSSPRDSGSPPDLTSGGGGATCPTGMLPLTVTGGGPLTAAAVTQSSARYFSDGRTYEFFVCRDAGGLYALSATCTHEGCSVRKSSTSSKFVCPCHSATFDYNGQNPTYPAGAPLEHYALCVDGAGSVFVDPSQVVTPTTRA